MSPSLVTGVAGFIGSSLAESILKDGGEVIGVDALTDYYSPDLKKRNLERLLDYKSFKFFAEDLADLSTNVRDALNSSDTIFHQAGQPGVRGSWKSGFDDYVKQNIVVTQRILEAIENKPATKFVYASSSSIYGNAETWPCSERSIPQPFSPYGVTKLSAEHLVSLYSENFGLDGVSLRYFTVYGPRQRPDMAFNRFIDAALSNREITVYGDGNQIRDFTFIEDIVNANRLAAKKAKPGGIYNLSGGSNASVNEVLGLLSEMVAEPLKVIRVPEQAGDVRRTGGDSSSAAEDLGWRADVSLREGLQRQFQHQSSVTSTGG
ncbi:UDP-glucose 4-epimerase [Rhodococcus sp. 06-221-2]|uniref:NAD-dependent epimerase/dehydratase family protein n=1 Tax=Rhodococcus sp. 06-221-2 TaxID=2022514 RepID=UPI000B9C26EF|nr:NAD-dependent epimerase/dehydratase family protein [Rhodococcus sp. 06-221-2]OZC96813.1 UDP-glucose 4-epimerase [Rhodococcus sp. 06-221-2]